MLNPLWTDGFDRPFDMERRRNSMLTHHHYSNGFGSTGFGNNTHPLMFTHLGEYVESRDDAIHVLRTLAGKATAAAAAGVPLRMFTSTTYRF